MHARSYRYTPSLVNTGMRQQCIQDLNVETVSLFIVAGCCRHISFVFSMCFIFWLEMWNSVKCLGSFGRIGAETGLLRSLEHPGSRFPIACSLGILKRRLYWERSKVLRTTLQKSDGWRRGSTFVFKVSCKDDQVFFANIFILSIVLYISMFQPKFVYTKHMNICSCICVRILWRTCAIQVAF